MLTRPEEFPFSRFYNETFWTQDFTKKKRLYLQICKFIYVAYCIDANDTTSNFHISVFDIVKVHRVKIRNCISYAEKCICQLVDVYIVKGLSWPYRSKETRAIFRKIPLSEDSRFKPSEKPSRPFSARKSAEASKRWSSRTGIEIAAEWIGFRRDRSPVVSRDEMQTIDALILRLRVRWSNDEDLSYVCGRCGARCPMSLFVSDKSCCLLAISNRGSKDQMKNKKRVATRGDESEHFFDVDNVILPVDVRWRLFGTRSNNRQREVPRCVA